MCQFLGRGRVCREVDPRVQSCWVYAYPRVDNLLQNIQVIDLV